MKIESYLFFNGRSAEALAFYEKAVDAKKLALMTFNDSPEPPPEEMVPKRWRDKVMHMAFSVGETTVMASDGTGSEADGFKGFALSLNVKTDAEADRYFGALSEGGSVQMPLGKTFWSPRFGMLTDKFGVSWMVGIVPDQCQP